MKRHPRPVKRRRILKWTLAGVTTLGLGITGGVTYLFGQARIDTVGEVDFATRLKIPEAARSQIDAEGRRVFDLKCQKGTSELKPGLKTNAWGYNGGYLGPVLRAKRGETVKVNVRNSLDETTSVHWHGMHLPAKMDGGPHQPIAAYDTWTPSWKIDQPAATLWYHPHPHGQTARHVYRGLAGMFIVDDDDEAALDLPREYGVDDIPVIVQDKNFGDDGSLDESESLIADTGILGGDILVNGTFGPYFDVTTDKVRLRILNASNARVYRFGFADRRNFAMIASDGGLLSQPHVTRSLRLSPGERAEIVVDFSPGETVELRSNPPDLGDDFFESRSGGGDDSFDILQLRAAKRLAPAAPLPKSLVEIPAIDAEQAVETRNFDISGRSINGATMDMNRVDFGVAKGAVEIWEVTNIDFGIHNFHVHDVQFQVLSIDGDAPPPWLAGWKDTVYLDPGRKHRLALRFTDYADPDMPYMFHCHILFHEDTGLMGQFVVLDEGEEIGSVGGGHSGHHGD